MLVTLISDIHANFEALSAISEVVESTDMVICLGDIVGYYCQVNEVIDYLRKIDAHCILGNHDNFVLRGYNTDIPPAVKFGIDYAKQVINNDNLKWLSELPLVIGDIIDGKSILMVHGSPWNPMNDYLYSNNQRVFDLYDFQYDVIAFGQTHRRFKLIQAEKPYILNPGSIGQSRDVICKACALIWNTQTMDVEWVIRNYDSSKVIEEAIKHGAQQWIYKHLR